MASQQDQQVAAISQLKPQTVTQKPSTNAENSQTENEPKVLVISGNQEGSSSSGGGLQIT